MASTHLLTRKMEDRWVVWCLLLVCSVRAATRYTLNPSDAYNWLRRFPQSCQCIQNQVPSSSCRLFECLCTCDLSAQKCDYNCCCDPDCSSEQIQRFQTLEACAFEGHTDGEVEVCYSSLELYGVNPRSPLGGQSTSQEAVGKALCVEARNNVLEELYFSDSDVQSTDVFNQDEGMKDYSYVEDGSVILTRDVSFDQNDTIAAFHSASINGVSTLTSTGKGLFTLPGPDGFGVCNDNNFITFENDVPLTFCERKIASSSSQFISQCQSANSMKRYVTDLYVARMANILPANGFTDFSRVVNVALSAVQFRDFYTGKVTDITAQWTSNACTTSAYMVSAMNSASLRSDFTDSSSSCSAYSTESALTSLDLLLQSSVICRGYVQSVEYTVSHDTSAAAEITAVTAVVIVTDVPISGNGTSVVINHSYKVLFSSSNAVATASTGNLVKRVRSGNPGYIRGRPVLFGTLDTSGVNDVISELISGLVIASPIAQFDSDNSASYGKGMCSKTSFLSVDAMSRSLLTETGTTTDSVAGTGAAQVGFGYDISTGCVLSLNRNTLRDLCCTASNLCDTVNGNSEYSSSATGVPYFLQFFPGYVGIYGDADPLDVTKWLNIDYSSPGSSGRTWNEITSTCEDMFTSLNIEFLVTYSGEMRHPQQKIVSARAQVQTSNMRMTVPHDDVITEQKFPLQLTVTFVYKKTHQLEGYSPPAPPVLFKVPYDVFYPFLNPDKSSGGHHIIVCNWCIIVTCLVFCLLSLFFCEIL